MPAAHRRRGSPLPVAVHHHDVARTCLETTLDHRLNIGPQGLLSSQVLGRPDVVCSSANTPLMPSKSALIKTFMQIPSVRRCRLWTDGRPPSEPRRDAPRIQTGLSTKTMIQTIIVDAMLLTSTDQVIQCSLRCRFGNPAEGQALLVRARTLHGEEPWSISGARGLLDFCWLLQSCWR